MPKSAITKLDRIQITKLPDPGACAIKLNGFFFHGKVENLRFNYCPVS